MDRGAHARPRLDSTGLEGRDLTTGWHLCGSTRLERRPFLWALLLGDTEGAGRLIPECPLRLKKNVAVSHPSPFLTVAVPTYNGSAHLAESLQSILTQKGPDF